MNALSCGKMNFFEMSFQRSDATEPTQMENPNNERDTVQVYNKQVHKAEQRYIMTKSYMLQTHGN